AMQGRGRGRRTLQDCARTEEGGRTLMEACTRLASLSVVSGTPSARARLFIVAKGSFADACSIARAVALACRHCLLFLSARHCREIMPDKLALPRAVLRKLSLQGNRDCPLLLYGSALAVSSGSQNGRLLKVAGKTSGLLTRRRQRSQ